MLAALVALVALSAYFSATETAFTSLNRIRLKTRADDGDKRAARTLALAADFDRLLSTLLIGNNIVNNVATTIGAVLFIQLIGPGKGPTVSATVLTIVILIFGEVTPKSLAKERPEAWAIVATPLLRVMAVLLTPVNFLFTQWKKLLRVLLRHQDDDGITEEELMGMVDQAETEGSLDQHESDLIRNAIEFNDMEVSEILTPGWTWRPWRTPPPWRKRRPCTQTADSPGCRSITTVLTISSASCTRRTSTPPIAGVSSACRS